MAFIQRLGQLRSPVSTYANLPLSSNVLGDVRLATDTGDAYTWMISSTSGVITDWKKVTTSSYNDLVGAPSSSALAIDDAVKVVTGLSINVALMAFQLLTEYGSAIVRMFDGVVNEIKPSAGLDDPYPVDEAKSSNFLQEAEYALPNKGDLDIYTKLLIHGDGVQGSQSFQDLLRHQLVISGSITDTTTKKFGTGSIKFDGTNDYMDIFYNPLFSTVSECLDFWFYGAAGVQPIFANAANLYVTEGQVLSIKKNASNKIEVLMSVLSEYVDDVPVYDNITVESNSTISSNTWTHIAIQRIADGNIQIWINGILDAVSTQNLTGYLNLGSGEGFSGRFGKLSSAYLNGYLDEIRFSNTERYTTTFTPMTKAYNTATTPAPAPEIVDESDSEHEVTVNGNARMSGTNPLFGNASLYLDGINSYLSLADSDDWQLSTIIPSGGIDSAVKLLLHLDNDVVDSELTPKTITNNGVTFSSSVKKFGSHAASFNGSSAYLSIPASSDFNFGTADFTIDFWCTVADVDARSPIFHTNDSSATSYIGFYARWLIPDNPLKPLVSIPGLGSSMRGFDMSLNTWTHLALVRYNNVLYLYQNGVLAESRSYSAAINLGSFTQLIGTTPWGGFHTGGLDELRISKGIARWTSEFTPPIAPYGGYGSNFLTGGTASSDSYYASPYTADKAVDGSTSTMWVSDLNPFPHWWKYDLGSGISKTVNKVRIYNFSDSNGNHLKDFTVQGSNDDSNWTVVYTGQGANIPADWQEFTFSNTTAYRYYKIVENNTWRSDNAGRLMEIKMMEEIPALTDYTVDLWIDPLSLSDADAFIIGQDDAWKLTLDGTSNKYLKYTVVDGGGIFDSLTKLLLHFDNNVIDEAGKSVTNNNVTFSSATKKFGTHAAQFNGTSSYLSIPDSEDWNFGSGDFTIDFWINPMDTGSWTIFSQSGPNGMGLHYNQFGTNYLVFQYFINYDWGAAVYAIVALTPGTWYHIALVHSSGTKMIFVNGVSQSILTWGGSGSNPTGNSDEPFCIGKGGFGCPNYLHAYIDEFRVSKGIARWTSNFTPPTSAYNPYATSSIIAPIALSLETWQHVAIVQKDGILKLYVNGILGASIAGSATVNRTSVLSIGADASGAHTFNGFIEEVRVSNNARWAAAFTPPSVEYSSDSNTKLLLPLNVQTVPNMVLQSVGYVSNYVPTSARVVIFEEDIDVMEQNVDLKIEVSRDGGTTFTTCLIAKDQEFGDGTLNLFSGSVDLQGQPNGELLVWKLTTQNNKDCRIRGISLSWR